MAMVFSNLGVTIDRRLHEFADVSHEALDRLKRKSLQDLYGETTTWVQRNMGKVIVGAVATGFLFGCLFRRSMRR
jgi:hypothetical protein